MQPSTPASIPFPELLARFRENPRSLLGQNPGIRLYDKPAGLTSFDVVFRARRALGLRRVGHGGTLDPMATGLLVVFLGNAARLFDELHRHDKEYVAAFRLGQRTDTLDATGQVTEERPGATATRAQVETALAAFRGDIEQVPPMWSAVKQGGRKLVDLARKGQTVARAPRPAHLDEVELLDFDGFEGKIRLVASKGFYVRTLIDDLGEKLGTLAVMTALRRTRVATFRVEEAEPVPPRPEGAKRGASDGNDGNDRRDESDDL